MAKTVSGKKKDTTSKAPAKQTGKLAGAFSRSAPRGEDKHSSAPRGAVSTKPAGRLRTFFREVIIEMKKVTWPPRKELIKSTGVVIIAVVIAAVFIGAFDYLWNTVIKAIGLGG
jgi:preprotein translocase subunit SecE